MFERRLNSSRLRPKKPFASRFGVTLIVIDWKEGLGRTHCRADEAFDADVSFRRLLDARIT